MPKIIITDEIISDVLSSGKSINDVLSMKYKDDISAMVEKNSNLKNVSPIKLSMLEFGLDKKSIIKDFTTASASEWLLPAFIDTQLRETVGMNSMLGYFTNSSVGVDGLAVMAATLDLVNDAKNKDNITQKRVSEGADLPLARITLGEERTSMYKRGRAVESTYEALQYLRVDLFAKTIDSIANDVADQQTGDAIEVLARDIATIETATANVITDDDMINAMIEFQEKSKRNVTTVVASHLMFKQLYKMMYKNDLENGATYRMNFVTPQFNSQTINLILDKRVPKNGSKEQVLFLNNDVALVKYFANGSNIREIDRNIRNQTQLGTISEIAGFSVFDKNARLALVSK